MLFIKELKKICFSFIYDCCFLAGMKIFMV